MYRIRISERLGLAVFVGLLTYMAISGLQLLAKLGGGSSP